MKLQNTELLRTRNLIAGQWVDADAGGKLAVLNPASGDKLADVPLCGADETRRAIDAANAAWPAWRALTARRRSQILQAWNRLILDNADDLAQIVTAECGKPLAEARGEVIYGASFVEWFAEEGKRTYGESIPSPASNTRLLVIKQPIGVCAAITPWNFPLAMITRKVAPALAAGCPVVVKPAEATPLTALALAVLAEQAGFPAGVFNVVTGQPAAIGGELCANPIVRKLSFTGSTAVGRLLMAQCAPTIKKLSLELGGNAPFIVFDDADLDAATDAAAQHGPGGRRRIARDRQHVDAESGEAGNGQADHHVIVHAQHVGAQALVDLPPDNVVTGSSSEKTDKKHKKQDVETSYTVEDANEYQRETLVDSCMFKSGWDKVEVQ